MALASTLDWENCWIVLAAADRLQLQPLKERSAAYGRTHFVQATSCEAGLAGWCDLPLDLLMAVLTSDTIDCDESAIFEAAAAWIYAGAAVDVAGEGGASDDAGASASAAPASSRTTTTTAGGDDGGGGGARAYHEPLYGTPPPAGNPRLATLDQVFGLIRFPHVGGR